MLANRKYDIAAIVLLLFCVVAWASFRSEYRLRPNMPAEFFDGSKLPSARRTVEAKIAKAYWKSAVTQVQWKYGYAHRLPEDAPEEFSIPPDLAGSTVEGASLRAFYWRRLRAIWDMPTVWQEQYTWGFIPLTQSLRSGGDRMEQMMHQLTRY